MDSIQVIVGLVESAARSFERGLDVYWPVVNPDKNSLQEANLTLHFGCAALNAGLHVYPEASNSDVLGGHSRIDLLVFGDILGEQSAVLVEAKRLYSSEKAAELVSGYNKILKFAFVEDGSTANNSVFKRFGLLLALTTREEDAKWWRQPYKYDYGASWDALMDVLESSRESNYIEINARRKQYLLYAVFSLVE